MKFHKDKQGLPFINLDGSAQEAAKMLMQLEMSQHTMMVQTANNKDHEMLVKTVGGNFEGFTKNKVLRAKQACCAQVMMGNPSKKDYKGVVSNRLISNCPINFNNMTNSRAVHGPALASVQGKNSTTSSSASGDGLRGSATLSGGAKQNSDIGGRCLLHGWHRVSDDCITESQVHYSRTCASTNS